MVPPGEIAEIRISEIAESAESEKATESADKAALINPITPEKAPESASFTTRALKFGSPFSQKQILLVESAASGAELIIEGSDTPDKW